MRTMRQIRLASLVVAASLLALGGTAVAAPRPRTTGGITGSVQLPSGAPAVGVKVEAFHNESTENPQEPNMVLAGTTTTDAQGAYAFSRLAAGDYRIKLTPSDPALAFRFVDDDDLSATPWHGEAIMVGSTTVAAPLVKLFPSGTMTGLVFEEGTGKPLAGMTVQLTFQAPSRINPLAVGTTAADGTFRISQLPPTGAAAGPDDRATGSIIGLEFDSLDVWPWVIDPTGWHRDAVGYYLELPFPPLDRGATADLGTPIAMAPAGKVSGVVLDARGRPIPGIMAIAVQAHNSGWGAIQWEPVDYAAQATDAKGRFTITVTPGVALRIKVMDGRINYGFTRVLDAWATEYWPAAPVPELGANVVATAGKTLALATPFTLERGAGFEGVVTGPGVSEPWSQGMFPWVSMLVNGTWYQAAYTYVFADGWYGFDGLPAGTYRVNFGTSIPIAPNNWRFYGEDWQEKPSGQGDLITLAAGDHRYGIDEWMDPVMLHLIVNVQGGTALQGVQVQVVLNNPNGNHTPVDGWVSTDQDGRAELWVPVSAQAGQPFGYGVQGTVYGPQGQQQRWQPVFGPYVAGQTIEQTVQLIF